MSLNKAIQCLSLQLLLHYWKVFVHLASKKKHPIVSFQSGNGSIEKYLATNLGKPLPIPLYCVDRDPFSFASRLPQSLMHLPDFPSLESLLAKESSLIGGCCLFLNWTEPQDNNSDLESIRLLQPDCILLVLDSTGSSGSTDLHSWLKKEVKGYTEIITSFDSISGHERKTDKPLAQDPDPAPDPTKTEDVTQAIPIYTLVQNSKFYFVKENYFLGIFIYRYLLLVKKPSYQLMTGERKLISSIKEAEPLAVLMNNQNGLKKHRHAQKEQEMFHKVLNGEAEGGEFFRLMLEKLFIQLKDTEGDDV